MGTGASEEAVFVLDPGTDVLAQAPVYRDMATSADRLRALGRALTASPRVRDMEEAVLVVRTAEPMRLAMVGRFSPAEAARIAVLPAILEKGLSRLRYVSYADAERAARALAHRLIDGVGEETLSRCRFVALPRGGLFVLGMLAYLLDLRADQVGDPLPSESGENGGNSPLVLVDDCSLSGLRFAETLERLNGSSVIFAHLFSHPQLRDAIRDREPRVVGCYSGGDLRDLCDESLEEDRAAWEERWRERSGGRAYWIGLPEHVCFPWNEPDITIWNAETESEEAPWRIVPPEFCLKNGPVVPGLVRLQEQPACQGGGRPADATVFARFEGEVLAANVETGRAFSFPGIAGEIWMALVGGASPSLVVDALATEYDVESTRLRADVDSVLERALELGLLRRVDDD
ncbi:MAG: PqqD family peptide modification chaperone [marine benthic group bacterium]|nr:PqqD family peptide modification chaperone [Gemmatimonadota bacterium]